MGGAELILLLLVGGGLYLLNQTQNLGNQTPGSPGYNKSAPQNVNNISIGSGGAGNNPQKQNPFSFSGGGGGGPSGGGSSGNNWHQPSYSNDPLMTQPDPNQPGSVIDQTVTDPTAPQQITFSPDQVAPVYGQAPDAAGTDLGTTIDNNTVDAGSGDTWV